MTDDEEQVGRWVDRYPPADITAEEFGKRDLVQILHTKRGCPQGYLVFDGSIPARSYPVR